MKASSDSFNDFFSHARLFWNSVSQVEKQHVIEAFSFELGKVNNLSVRKQVVDMFANVDKEMATIIAYHIAVDPPKGNHVPVTASSPALSQANTKHFPHTLTAGVIISNGFNGKEVKNTIDILRQHGVFVKVISDKLGDVVGEDGTKIKVDHTFLTTHNVLLDSLYVVGGHSDHQSIFNLKTSEFISGIYKHYKPIGVATTGQSFFQPSEQNNLAGVIFAENNQNFGEEFVSAIATQRFWKRM